MNAFSRVANSIVNVLSRVLTEKPPQKSRLKSLTELKQGSSAPGVLLLPKQGRTRQQIRPEPVVIAGQRKRGLGKKSSKDNRFNPSGVDNPAIPSGGKNPSVQKNVCYCNLQTPSKMLSYEEAIQ